LKLRTENWEPRTEGRELQARAAKALVEVAAQIAEHVSHCLIRIPAAELIVCDAPHLTGSYNHGPMRLARC